jgi:polyhydroxybutyrate depolymerase
MKQKALFIALMLLVVVLGVMMHLFHWNPFDPLHEERLTIGSLAREFNYYVPKYLSNNPGLLFVLHGTEMTSSEMRHVTGRQFDRFADKYKDFIVVYPQGFHGFWNDCRKAGTFDARRLNVDDVAFFDSMAGYFLKKYSIDTSRVFAAGYSNGGQMCYKLAKEKPEMFKGVAVLCANLPVATNDDCSDGGKPISVLIMNGTADPINPYNGGVVTLMGGKTRGEVLSTDQTLNYWLARDSCDTSRRTEYDFPDVKKKDNSSAIQYSYSNPSGSRRVALVKIINGGHTIPNPGFSSWLKILGNVNKDINAPEVIVKFFRDLE